MAAASAAVFAPMFFCQTLPSWLTMKVITLELPHSSGHATRANHPEELLWLR